MDWCYDAASHNLSQYGPGVHLAKGILIEIEYMCLYVVFFTLIQ